MNDFDLGEKLRECLLQLVKGKVTERKNKANDLKSFLTQDLYLNYLNRSSLRKRNGSQGRCIDITWKTVFHKIKEYIELECQKFKEKESSQNLSALVITNIIKEKRKCFDLFRCYMKALHHNKQYDMATLVMKHVLAVLHDSYTRSAFGSEYSLMLSKYILSDPFMCLTIYKESEKDLDDAIWLFCKIIKNPPSGWDRGIMTQVFLHLLTVRSNLGTLDAFKMLDFFTHMFDVLKSEKVSNHHENLLKCLLHVCKSLGVDYRLRLCQLGESIMLPLLQLWKTRPSELCSELMLEFISLQLALHHPKGAVDEEKGAQAHDLSSWKSLLLSLYKIIVMEIIELGEKNKYSSSKETVLKPIFVSVAVEVFAQVLVDSVGVLDVTQLSSTFEGSMPTKKRRIEVCFRTFTDYLSSPKIIPWLQVISAFISKYPENVSILEAEHLLDSLIDINLSCNQFETKNWLLNCFQSFVQAFGNRKISDFSEPHFNWQRLWDLGVKSVALMHQCQDAGHRLLVTLLSHKLIHPKADFYHLYTPGSSNRVTRASLQTLGVFLEKYQSVVPINTSFENSISRDAFAFENQIIEWLFSRKSDDSSPFEILSSEGGQSATEEFAYVITLLCLKNTAFRNNAINAITSDTPNWILDMEEEMLKIMFHSSVICMNDECANAKSWNVDQSVLCPTVWEKILQLFIVASSSIFEDQTFGNQISNPSILIKHACLMFDVLQASYFQGILKEQDFSSNIFILYLKRSLNTAFEIEMKKEEKQVNDRTVSLFRDFINHVAVVFEENYQPDQNQDSQSFIVAVANAIPIDILNHLLNFSLENIDSAIPTTSINLTQQNASSNRPHKKNRYAAFDDEDMDIEIESFECEVEIEDTIGMVDTGSSNEDFQQKIHCLETLGKYCSFISSETWTNNRPNSFPDIMKKKLVTFINSKSSPTDFKRMDDVHLVLFALKCILLNKHLGDGDVECVINAIKHLLNQFNVMQDLCISILELFPLLFPHLFQSCPAQNMSQNRSHVLHLLHILSKKELNRKGSSQSYLIAKNIFCVLKMEPSICWSGMSENLTGDNLSQSGAVVEAFHKFLYSPFVSVRLFVAVNLHAVMSAAVLESVFASACSEMFDFLCPSNPVEFDPDACVNRVSTFFHYLRCIIIHFPCLEKEAIFTFCKVVKTKMTSQYLAVKVLSQISAHLGYESVRSFLELHLNFLFNKWIQAKYDLERFPYAIFEADSIDAFFMDFYKTLIPGLFLLEDVPSISKIAQKLHLTDSEIIYACLPGIESKLLPGFAKICERDTGKFKNMLHSFVPVDVREKAFMSKLDEIVVLLLSMLKDDKHSHLQRCMSYDDYSITFEDFCSTVLYITSQRKYKGSFVSFLNQKPDCIQKIFLSLSVMLSKTLRAHDGGRVLFMYQCFLKILKPELNPELTCSYFVIKEVIYSIIHFLTAEKMLLLKDVHCISDCCDILLLLCSKAVLHFKEIIGDFLPFIISNLTPFVDETESGKKVLSVLSFLVIDCEEYLADYIPYLDPFPDKELFRKLTIKHASIKYKAGILPLEQEIKLFLKSCKMMGKATAEGLQHLCQQLKSRKEDLLNMLNLLKEKVLFSEDIKTSVLHQLICQLTSICALENSPVKVQNAASACIGAIGPIALSSVVLQPSSNADSGGLNSVQHSFAVLLNLLTDYLFDKRIEIKITSSEIMKELFVTKTAYAFYVNYQILSPNNPVTKYASPFFDYQNAKHLRTTCKYNLQLETIQELSLWIPDSAGHSEWITKLVCSIIEGGLSRTNFYECLLPICKKEVSFCEKILPFLIHAILLCKNEEVENAITTGIGSFFSTFSLWMQTSSQKNGNFCSPDQEPTFSKASVRSMLDILHHLWLNPKQESKSHRNILKDNWLKISYLEVAQAAQYCSAYFTAILYTELWCDFMKEKARETEMVDQSDSSGSLECSPLSFIGSKERERASLVYDILLDTYSQIGDSDAIRGCEVVATDSQAILKHSYLIEKKWDGLLKISDMNHSSLEILQALQQSNLNFVLQGYIQSLMHDQDHSAMLNIREHQCEAAWRMGQWNLSIPNNNIQGFQELLLKSQQSLVAENNLMFDKFVYKAQKTQCEYLKHISLEAARNIQSVLSNIQMLSVLHDFSKVQSNSDELQDILKSWSLQDQMPYDDYIFVEPVSWLKCISLKHLVDVNLNKQLHVRSTFLSELKKLLEKHAVKARNELHLEIASNAIHILRKLPCMEEVDLLRLQIEEAKILWTKKEFGIANKILKSALPLMEKLSKENTSFLLNYGQALTLKGRWLAETCNENSGVIMRDYLEKALDVLRTLDSNTSVDSASAVCDAYLAVARYADNQYQSIVNYKNSTAYQTKQELVANSREEAEKLKSKDLTDDEKKLHLILTKQSSIDLDEMKSVEADRRQFLEKAVINYLHCLRGSDTHDLWIFRLVSLWFQNLDVEEINLIIKEKIHDLHTYKFLPLMYQLAARIGTQASKDFTCTLASLIRNIAIQHPHHALPVILALSNADKDPASRKEVTDQTVFLKQAEVPAVKERMNAAKNILSALQKSKISTILKSYSDLCDAYISLAYLPVEKNVKKGTIPKEQSILKFKNLQNIPIITEEVKVDRSCEYKNIIGIHSFHSEFRMCGGITLPKVIKCVGVDGIEREQLVKGSDDLRQDAVMQQVFCLVNCLLKQKRETQQRKLHIRTYKVVPVSRRSGVLQWCEGTQVLSQYLVGTGGAHVRYYPTMATPIECRKKMMSIAKISQLPEKRQVYDSICANFPPVFRYFFLENFSEPSAWFERRQSYTKSVAASSIVGYILGLGDRHVNNILIDKNTAEVVHIDFGIAFEKGRILATPETVPFRLTRDLVDGMGISGVEGIFKRCSEKTLEVMRNSQDVLLTILEVLLHDPLYEWTVPAKKSQGCNSSSNSQSGKEVNTLAERALMRLQQKLQGLEEGIAMSTEGQINLLIQQARDPNNLCRIYAGWQPYL